MAVILAGGTAYRFLPVSPLPQVDFPTISVSAGLPRSEPRKRWLPRSRPRLSIQFSHIAGVTEMTSSSSLGSSGVTLQFELSRDIDAAARDVQAAINAARGYLPANLPSNPTYRKVNAADSPIFIIALTSKELDRGKMYDAASTIMAQKLAQIRGVGQVLVGGSALPGVRIELDPTALNGYGINLEDVRTALAATNAHTPTGQVSDGRRTWELVANDQLFKAIDYAPVIIAQQHGDSVRISDVGESRGFGRGSSQCRLLGRSTFGACDRLPAAWGQHYRYGGSDPSGASAT